MGATVRRKTTPAPVDVVTEAIGYIRVSTQEQADSGLGLAAQKARVEAYAVAQGWQMVGVYVDEFSGKTLNRPALQEAIAALRPGRVLLALKLDRLTRTARDLDDLTALVQERGGDWATVEGNYDTSNAMGRFMLRLVAELAQLEREVTAERTVAALGAKKVRRERLGTTPLGFRTEIAADGSMRVSVDDVETETVLMARELAGQGMTLRAGAAELTRRGRKTKRGGRWAPQTVAVLLTPRYLEEIGQ